MNASLNDSRIFEPGRNAGAVPETEEANAGAWLAIFAGVLTALAVAVRLSRFSLAAHHSFSRALLDATMWIAVTALAGTAGLWLIRTFRGRRDAGGFGIAAADAAASWVLLPPLLLLSQRESLWTLVFTAFFAAGLALCLYRMQRGDRGNLFEAPPETAVAGPFAELPGAEPGHLQSFLISACVQGAAVYFVRHYVFVAVVLMAVGSFLLAGRIIRSPIARIGKGKGRPAARLAAAATLALLIVAPLLLAGPGGLSTGQAGSSRDSDDGRKAAANKQQNASAADGYQGIILWPIVPENKEVVLPAAQKDPLRAGTAKPFIIPFDGSYWYFQAPRHGPGLHAHMAHGDPVAMSIRSADWIPLAMQAHQSLSQPIELSCCGQMRVTIENGDNREGRVDVGVLLTDSASAGKPSVFLGIRPIESTEPDHFYFKTAAIDEVLTFSIPVHAGIVKFDQITVLLFPGEERATFGARVGIRQFELLPR